MVQEKTNECFKDCLNKTIASLLKVCELSIQDCCTTIERLTNTKFMLQKHLIDDYGAFTEDEKERTSRAVTGKINLQELVQRNWHQLQDQLAGLLI